MILRNIAAFIGLCLAMLPFVAVWLTIDYFTKGF